MLVLFFLMARVLSGVLKQCSACLALSRFQALLSQWERLALKNATAIAPASPAETVSLKWMGRASRTIVIVLEEEEVLGQIVPLMDKNCVYGAGLDTLLRMEFVRRMHVFALVAPQQQEKNAQQTENPHVYLATAVTLLLATRVRLTNARAVMA